MTLTKPPPAQTTKCGVPIAEGDLKFKGTDVAVENLFRYLDDGWNLHAFLDDFPSVSAEQAVAVLWDEARGGMGDVVHSDRRIVGGTPVFRGTRLPVKSLFDHLARGYSLDAFLYQFPTASKEQAVAALEAARKAMESHAYENTAR